MTPLGAFFIPITLACLVWTPAHLLPLLVVASVFEAGTVMNSSVGNFVFGLSPFYMVEIAIAFCLLRHLWNGGAWLPPKSTPARPIAILLFAFLGWSLFSAFVMPRLFAGMPIVSPRDRIDVDLITGNLTPLQWTFSNLGQGIYLALNVGAALFAFLLVQSKEQARGLAQALRWALVLVVVAGLLQYALPLIGGSYPYSVFNNNPNNTLASTPLDQQIDGFTRISSTFAEPMNSGSFLAAVAGGLLASYLRGQRGIGALLWLIAVLFVLLQTTSTTGYVTVVVMLLPLLAYFNPLARPKLPGQPSFFKGWAAAACTAAAIVAFALLWVPGLLQAFVPMTVDKSEGMSYLSRVAADQESFAMFTDTYGIGVGLGSSRPASLLMTLLSTVGIVGTALFAMVLYHIARLFPGRRAPSPLQMSFWSLAGLLVASMGVPDINRPALWALLIMVPAQSQVYSGVAGDSV